MKTGYGQFLAVFARYSFFIGISLGFVSSPLVTAQAQAMGVDIFGYTQIMVVIPSEAAWVAPN